MAEKCLRYREFSLPPSSIHFLPLHLFQGTGTRLSSRDRTKCPEQELVLHSCWPWLQSAAQQALSLLQEATTSTSLGPFKPHRYYNIHPNQNFNKPSDYCIHAVLLPSRPSKGNSNTHSDHCEDKPLSCEHCRTVFN